MLAVRLLAEHGFLRDKHGAFTTIDAPGSTGSTEVLDINPSGVIIGDDRNDGTGFIRYPNGSFTTIDTGSLACGGGSLPYGINPAGAVNRSNLLVRARLFANPRWNSHHLQGARRVIHHATGHQSGGADHGIRLHTARHSRLPEDSRRRQFDPPGGFFTFPTAINPAGAITGNYSDANGFQHGFLRLP